MLLTGSALGFSEAFVLDGLELTAGQRNGDKHTEFFSSLSLDELGIHVSLPSRCCLQNARKQTKLDILPKKPCRGMEDI